MGIPQVETFETDITEEIRQKQGSVTDVLAAHSSNKEVTPNQGIIRLITFVIILLLVAVCTMLWYYFSLTKQTELANEAAKNQVVQVRPPVVLKTILPKTSTNIERFVTKAKSESAGYVLTVNDYGTVYSTLLANEKTLGEELIKLFNIKTNSVPRFKDVTVNNQDMRIATLVLISTSTEATSTTVAPATTIVPAVAPVATTTSKAATTTKSVATSTKNTSATSTLTTATSTKLQTTKGVKATTTSKVASSTPLASSTELVLPPPVVIPEDILDPNLSYDYVSYGFIGTSTLLISTSKEKLLELRSGIIK
jgi:hypothetical protein